MSASPQSENRSVNGRRCGYSSRIDRLPLKGNTVFGKRLLEDLAQGAGGLSLQESVRFKPCSYLKLGTSICGYYSQVLTFIGNLYSLFAVNLDKQVSYSAL